MASTLAASIPTTVLGDSTSLLELCPANATVSIKGAQLTAAVDKYKIIVDIALKAIQQFLAGHLTEFDALVGENACQIRASMFANLANLILSQPKVKLEVETHMNALAEVNRKLAALVMPEARAKMSLKDLLDQNHLLPLLPTMLQSVTLAYILTATKVSGVTTFRLQGLKIIKDRGSDRTVPAQLPLRLYGKEEVERMGPNLILSALSKALDNCARIKLAASSIAYVKAEAEWLAEAEDKELLAMVTGTNIKTDQCGRACIPCFAGLNVLMRSALVKRVPLLLKVTRIDVSTAKTVDSQALTILYRSSADGRSFQAVEDAEQSLKEQQAVIVIEGFSVMDHASTSVEAFYKTFRAKNVIEIVLGNAARHAQYPGTLKNEIPPIGDGRLNRYKEMAEQEGLGEAIPSLFDIDHIYCDMIQRQLPGGN